MIVGGIADKLGNRYEAKWTVRSLIDVIAGKANWLKFESVETEYRGFEFAVGVDATTHWHQTKFNAPTGNWTINALRKEGVLTAFANRLSASESEYCYFVSQDNAKDFRILTEKARAANSLNEYLKILSQGQSDCFEQIKGAWQQPDDILFNWLRRSYIEIIPERELDSFIGSYGDLYFLNGGSDAFPNLRDILENHFNKELTTESIREIIKSQGALQIKEWALDPTIPHRLHDETEAYLNTYSPFGAGGSTIKREQVNTLVGTLLDDNGKDLIILSGVAGVGKSGVVRGAIQALRVNNTPHLAFRVDHYLSCSTKEELGEKLIGRKESPVSTLKGTYPTTPSVLFVDQVDAVSEISGRDGQIKEVLFRLISDAHNFNGVKVVVVCRTFDLGSDSRLKALNEKDRAISIDVPLLDWSTDISPVLESRKFNLTSFGEPQRKILCLPVNLAVFLEIGDPDVLFYSRAGLHEKLIEKKQRTIRERNVSWSLVQALKAVSEWMSQRQMLSAPVSVLDDYPNAIDILTSEGMIVSSRGQINFFHESFFDHVYARGFVNGSQSLIDLLTSTEQHLFRRTQARQILEALRQNDFERYLTEMSSLFINDKIRFHIKVAVSQWLNSIDNPTEQEFEIISSFNEPNGEFHQFFSNAVLSTHQWFDFLYSNGWIKERVNSDNGEQSKQVLLWLSNIAGNRPVEVSGLWRNWWGNDKERADNILSWLGYLRRVKPDDNLLKLCEDIISTHPESLFQGHDRIMMVLENWSDKSPEQCGRILHLIFDAWFLLHPDKSLVERDQFEEFDIHPLSEIAKKAPQTLLQGMTDAIIRSVEMVIAEGAKGVNWYYLNHRTQSDNPYGFDAIFTLYRSALKKVAIENPKVAQAYLEKLSPNFCESMMHLHLECIQANPAVFASHLPSLFANKIIFNAGYDGAGWLSLAKACYEAFPFLELRKKEEIEQYIYNHNSEIERIIRHLQEIEIEGEREPYSTKKALVGDLKWAGFEQWCIFETIGENCLSKFSISRLNELRRKFPKATLPEPSAVKMLAVGSPIKRPRCAMMKDHHWLRAIERYDNESERYRGYGFVDGGARQLAIELQEVTKDSPERFSNLSLIIPDEACSTYIEHILFGLAESESSSEVALVQAVKRAHRHPAKPFGIPIARLIEKHPSIAADIETLQILIWYALNGDANDSNEVESQNVERETITINTLIQRGGGGFYIRGVNGDRGSAWEAIAAVLWKAPEMEKVVSKAMIEALENEELISVRCSMLKVLVPIFNLNKEFFSSSIRKLIVLPSPKLHQDTTLRLIPLLTWSAIDLFPYIFHWLPELGEELVGELLKSRDETKELIGAWHVFCESFRSKAYIEKADMLMEISVDHRRLSAGVAADVISWAENRHRAENILGEFFFDDDEQVRKNAANAFRNIKPDDVEKYNDLTIKFLNSPAFEDSKFEIMYLLKNATCNVLDLIIIATKKIVEELVATGDLHGTRGTGLHQIQDILEREYASSESNLEARKKILDLIDLMFRNKIYGVDRVVSSHDRW